MHLGHRTARAIPETGIPSCNPTNTTSPAIGVQAPAHCVGAVCVRDLLLSIAMTSHYALAVRFSANATGSLHDLTLLCGSGQRQEFRAYTAGVAPPRPDRSGTGRPSSSLVKPSSLILRGDYRNPGSRQRPPSTTPRFASLTQPSQRAARAAIPERSAPYSQCLDIESPQATAVGTRSICRTRRSERPRVHSWTRPCDRVMMER